MIIQRGVEASNCEIAVSVNVNDIILQTVIEAHSEK